jgi:hypothetical protein
MLKFLYTGSYVLEENKYLIDFIKISNKYIVNGLKEMSINQKLLLTSIIEYIEKDVEKRFDELDELLDYVNFDKLSYGILIL